MLAYDLPAGRALVRDRALLGRRWDVHVFQRAVFPLDAGTISVPPASWNVLTCSAASSTSVSRPQVIVPRASRETASPLRPSGRCCMCHRIGRGRRVPV